MQGLHDLLPHHDGGVRVRAAQDNLFRFIITTPDHSRVIGRVARKPAILVGGGGAGLAGHAHVAHTRCAAGTVARGILQHIIDIEARLLADGGVALLRVVQNKLSVLVDDLGVQSRLAEYAVIGEGCKRLRHLPHGHAVGLLAQRQRRQRNVGVVLSADGLLLDKRRNSHLFGQEFIAVHDPQIIQGLDGNGVQGAAQAAHDVAQAAVGSRIVEGPVPVVVQGGILVDAGRSDDPRFQRGRIDRNGLEGGAGGQQAHGRTVVNQAAFLFSHAAGHRDNIARSVVNQDDRRLELLHADRLGHVIQILVHAIHNCLRARIIIAVDLVAAGHQLHGGSLLAVTVFFAQILQHVVINGVNIVGIIVTVADGVVRRLTVRAVINAVLPFRIVLLGALKAALAADIGRLVVGAVVEEHFLAGHSVVFLLGLDVTLFVHLLQDRKLTLAVVLLADIGIVEGGIVGNADQAGTFGSGELRHVLSEVDARRALHAVAALAEINRVEIPLHDLVLGIHLFGGQRAEDLLNLSVDRHIVLVGQVLDQLLRDRGGTVGGIAAGKIGNGRKRSQPVHAVMLTEAFILDGDGRVYHIHRNLVIGDPDAVFGRLKLLQLPFLPRLGVNIINERSLRQGNVVQFQRIRRRFCRGDHVRLQVVLQLHRKNGAGHRTDQQKRSERREHKKHQLSQHGKHNAADPPRDMRLLFLIEFLFFLLCHLLPPFI